MVFLIKYTAILSLFYIFYKVVLQKETFFKAIRAYFLMGYSTALITPFIFIKKNIVMSASVIGVNAHNITDFSPATQITSLDWTHILLVVYFIGLVFFSIRFFLQLITLLRYLWKSEKTRCGKYFMITSTEKKAPFSFFNYIVYNQDQFKEGELKQILSHEKTHADQLHSIDTLLSKIVIITNWFNPLIWLYDREIQKNLEFLADGFALRVHKERKNYQYLLLKTISPNYQLALINNFYNSLIKNRINMLQKKRSNRIMYFKFTLMIPILIAFVFTFNTKVVAQHKQLKTVEIQKDIEVELITKDFTKSDLEKLKNRLAAKGVNFKYSKLKYNSDKEIISIDISVKSNKGSEARLSQKGTEAINPIQIKLDLDSGNIALGNMTHIHSDDVFFSSGDKMHKKYIVKKIGDGDDDMIWTSDDSIKVMKLKGDNSFTILSDDTDGKMDKYVYKIKRGDQTANVWVSKEGDTTKMKHIEVIKIDEDDNGDHKVIIKSGENDGNEEKIIIKSEGKVHGEHKEMMFISSGAENALFIVDGKEVPDGKLEDMDTKKIETIEILKGEKAVEKYGEKARDGVIIIKTK